MNMTHETDVFKSEKVDEVFAELKAVIRTARADGLPAHDVERALWDKLLALGRHLFGLFLQQLGSGDIGESLELPDGQVCQRLRQLHHRRYVSIFGEFQLWRTAYGSRAGQKIDLVPLDNRLQLPELAYSYVLQDWDQSFCVEEAFSKSAATIERMLGLKQPVDSLERMNGHMAQSVQGYRNDRAFPQPQEEGELFVLQADGKGVVMRREEPAAAVHRSKGEKASQKRMAIVGTAYTVDRYERTPEQVTAALFGDREALPKPRPEPRHKQVWASLPREGEDGTVAAVDSVYPWLLNEWVERNRDGQRETVCLHDGQESLWEARGRHLPKANCTDVLDLLHVTPRLWKAAHAFYGEGGKEVEPFVRQRVLKVLRGQSELEVRGLRRMATKQKLGGGKRRALREICDYLERNRGRMRYDEYLAKGYPIASGVIEGACRHLVKDRMERAGMHWSLAGAQAMLDVRSTWIRGDWEAFQSYYRERETRRLYPYRHVIEGVRFDVAL